MWDMEVLLVLRLCCNCTYGNNSAAGVCLETLLSSFSSVIIAGLSLWGCWAGALYLLDASACVRSCVFCTCAAVVRARKRVCEVPLKRRSL